MIGKKQKLELTWIGKENRPKLEPRILLEDPEPLMIHSEVVLRNGKPVGQVRAASYGHTLGSSVGLAMVCGEPVDLAYLERGEWAVNIAEHIYPARVSLRPFYDPEMKRIRS